MRTAGHNGGTARSSVASRQCRTRGTCKPARLGARRAVSSGRPAMTSWRCRMGAMRRQSRRRGSGAAGTLSSAFRTRSRTLSNRPHINNAAVQPLARACPARNAGLQVSARRLQRPVGRTCSPAAHQASEVVENPMLWISGSAKYSFTRPGAMLQETIPGRSGYRC